MHPHVGHFGQPAPRAVVEVLQGLERAGVEQVHFHIVKRPFHLALCLWPPRTAGHGPITVVRGEGQEPRVVDRLVVFVAGHHDLHVVVQAGGRHSAQVLEGPHVLADRGGEVLILREAQILTPRPGQNVAEQINPPPTVQNEVQIVLGVIHLGLLAGTGLKTLNQRPSRLRTPPPQMIPDDRILARKAAACQFLEHPHGGDVRIAGQQFLHRLLVIVQQTVPLDAGRGRDEAGCRPSRASLCWAKIRATRARPIARSWAMPRCDWPP